MEKVVGIRVLEEIECIECVYNFEDDDAIDQAKSEGNLILRGEAIDKGLICSVCQQPLVRKEA